MYYKGSDETVESDCRLVFIMRGPGPPVPMDGEPLEVTDDRFCVVASDVQPVTCHAGECGHHVHIRWRLNN